MQSHLQSTHADKCTGGAAVATSQRCDLPLLTQVTIDAVLDDRHMEHLGSCRAIEVFAVLECIQHPLFLCLPRQYTGFNGRKVSNDELAALFRNQHRADQLGENVWCIAVDTLDHIEAPQLHKRSRFIQRGNVVLWEVL